MADLGSDFGGVTDLDGALTIVGGRNGLLEALARRLSTRRGGLWYDPDYGLDLTMFLGTTVRERAIAAATEDECLKDERVRDIRAGVTKTRLADGSAQLVIDLIVTDERGPFSATLKVDALSVDILKAT